MCLTVGSLFSGAGLGDLGLEWAGLEHKWFCEVDTYARKILSIRWPGLPIYGDITKVDFTKVPRVDLLIGGFPCQGISAAGKGRGIKNDERSGLWCEFARAIKELRPKYIIIENSPLLVSRGLDIILCDLAQTGYNAEWQNISAAAFGAPHIRDRLWIVAYPQGNRGTVRGHRSFQENETVSETRNTHRKRMYFNGPGQWWYDESGLDRVVNGVANRLDRLRCTGNGQVPQVTYWIAQQITEHHYGN